MLTLKPMALTTLALGVGLASFGCAAPTDSEPDETTSAALIEDKQQVGQEQMLPGQEPSEQGPAEGQGRFGAEPGEQQDVLIDPETGEAVLDPETGEPIPIDPETGEPLGSFGEQTGEAGEAPAAATFFRGGWGRPGWGGAWRGGWGRPGWGGAWRGGWGRPGWGWGGGWRGGWW